MKYELVEEIKKLNNDLFIAYVLDSDTDEYLYQNIMEFMNDYLMIRIFNNIGEVNEYLTSIDDIKEFVKFYEKQGGDIKSCFYVNEGDYGYFISSDEFEKWFSLVINNMDIDETIEFNKFIMKKLY